ncbi:hypothetical protein BKA70DRAFT_1418551 [Coprinopsis sp. MPI-PUGE-AT-0042]|nr:hypothetical protein BKA70DRAFT_1418551 [Coprinopsis sp. MPI-PUGE-AT-0042]
MQFQVLVSFFFAYIAAVQASPVQLPNIPTEAISSVELPKVARDLPLVGDVVASANNLLNGVVESIPVEVPDVAGVVPLPSLEDINLPIPRDVSETLQKVDFEVHNNLPAFAKRQEEGTLSGIVMPIKGVVAPVVDTVLYEASPIVGAIPQVRRQLNDGVPAVPSTEGVAPEVKVPEVPSIPQVPSLPNSAPAVPINKRDVEVEVEVSTPKMVRVLRRQATGCADQAYRRSLDNTPTVPEVPSAPEVPTVPEVDTPSTPSLPTTV